MSLYYDGDVDKDIAQIDEKQELAYLDKVGKEIGYGRAQQILQILWARHLRDKGYPTSGALFR
jgi:hypothetical protein